MLLNERTRLDLVSGLKERSAIELTINTIPCVTDDMVVPQQSHVSPVASFQHDPT